MGGGAPSQGLSTRVIARVSAARPWRRGGILAQRREFQTRNPKPKCEARASFALCGKAFACHHRVIRRETAMRLLFSIGAVLVAGVLAGGDVAGVAAPGPKLHQPQRQAADGDAQSV